MYADLINETFEQQLLAETDSQTWMQNAAGKKITHAIPPRKKDNVDGTVKYRERRVSVTYRKVKPKSVRPIDPSGKVAHMLYEKFDL